MKTLFGRGLLLMISAVFSVSAFHLFYAYADSIALTDGKEVKGLIVEEHVDRIVVSTFDGEKVLNRSDIKYVRYEEEKMRLLNLAESALNTSRYEQAAYYYRKVLELDPDSTLAKDGLKIAIGRQLTSGAEIAKEKIDLMRALEQGSSAFKNETAENEKNIREFLGLGLAIDEKSGACVVKKVSPNSVSSDYGVRKGDILNSAWNTSLKYMTYESVAKELAGPEFSVVKLSLERSVVFDKEGLPGLNIGLHKEGYFVKDISGLRGRQKGSIAPGDWLLEVNSASTRYMPYNELQKIVRGADKTVSFLVKKDLYLRREKRR